MSKCTPNAGSFLATTVVCLALAAPTAAQQYSFRRYGAAEGLQNMVVLSLAQDRDGYIWAGTEGGLYRYDGTRFRLIGPAEGLPCATEIHTPMNGVLGMTDANLKRAARRCDALP
jgi:ligand-binding sensor domain-containing protein